jgi:subtilisin family serine protease
MGVTVCAIIAVLALLPSITHGTDSSVPFIHADQVHAMGITGFGVTVAVVGFGVDYADPWLAGHIADGGVSFVLGVEIPEGGADPFGPGHGTYMSLIITDPTGVAPDAKILPIRVGLAPVAYPGDVVRGIRHAIDWSMADPSIRIVNLSLGGGEYPCDCDSDDQYTFRYQRAIWDALSVGIVTFAVTGNEAGCPWMNKPACVSAAVKVAASYDGNYGDVYYPQTNCWDFDIDPYWVTCFSSIAGDCGYLLAAPGYDITVGTYSGYGTSQATAHCSGVAALMFSKNGCGTMSAYTARQTIYDTASSHDWGSPHCPYPPEPKHVDALAAVNAVSGPSFPVVGDLDCDGLVSGYDVPGFDQCMSGPGTPYPNVYCAGVDFPTADGDVDLRDLYSFQLTFDGMGSGACCHADGTCSITTVYDCLAGPGAVCTGPCDFLVPRAWHEV